MPGNPFKGPARPKATARVIRPQRPSAASRAQSRSAMPGVGSGMGKRSAPAQKPAKVRVTTKGKNAVRLPRVRQGAKL